MIDARKKYFQVTSSSVLFRDNPLDYFSFFLSFLLLFGRVCVCVGGGGGGFFSPGNEVGFYLCVFLFVFTNCSLFNLDLCVCVCLLTSLGML